MASAYTFTGPYPRLVSSPPPAMPAAEAPARYRRPFGRPRSPLVRQDIAALDAQRDCERIVGLLATYEFPFDLQRALEIALFHTYGSRSVARLLDRTGEFEKRGQKRYDDTRLLIAHFMQEGFTSGPGARAISQMNHIHSFYSIPNDDYLFVLWTFIDFPEQWMDEYGWRPFTDHEKDAWFAFWTEIGRRMNLAGIPATKPEFDNFVRAYEAREFVRNEPSERVARATLRIIAGWLPAFLGPLVAPVVLSLVRPQLRTAIGASEPPRWIRAAVHATLKTRRWVKRYVSLERVPVGIAGSPNATYPGNRYTIESLGPEHAHAR